MPKKLKPFKLKLRLVHSDDSEFIIVDDCDKIKTMFRQYVYYLLFHRESGFREIWILDPNNDRPIKSFKQYL